MNVISNGGSVSRSELLEKFFVPAVFAVLLMMCAGCVERYTVEISPYYRERVTRITLGDTGVRLALIGDPSGTGRKSIIISHTVTGSIGVLDRPTGRRVVFAEIPSDVPHVSCRIIACESGKRVSDVTDKVVSLGKAQGALDRDSQLGEDFIFTDVETRGDAVLGRVNWLRAHKTEGYEIIITWEQLFDSDNRPNQSPEPTVMSVTPRANARVAPATTVAHL